MNWYSIGLDNGLSPLRCKAISRTNAALLSTWPLGTMFSGILIKILNFSFMKMHLKTLSAKWRPFCLWGDELSNFKGYGQIDHLNPQRISNITVMLLIQTCFCCALFWFGYVITKPKQGTTKTHLYISWDMLYHPVVETNDPCSTSIITHL